MVTRLRERETGRTGRAGRSAGRCVVVSRGYSSAAEYAPLVHTLRWGLRVMSRTCEPHGSQGRSLDGGGSSGGGPGALVLVTELWNWCCGAGAVVVSVAPIRLRPADWHRHRHAHTQPAQAPKLPPSRTFPVLWPCVNRLTRGSRSRGSPPPPAEVLVLSSRRRVLGLFGS